MYSNMYICPFIQGGPKAGIQYTAYSIVLMVLLRY